MTLNITVTTPKCIYQCADFQLTNAVTKKPIEGMATAQSQPNEY